MRSAAAWNPDRHTPRSTGDAALPPYHQLASRAGWPFARVATGERPWLRLQKWYIALKLSWFPLVAFATLLPAIESSVSCIHSIPSS